MLDDTDLRSSKIHVERAKFEVKGTFNPELKRKRKKVDKKAKQQQVDKLLNWDERPEIVRHKSEKTVVIKNMFELQQFKVISSFTSIRKTSFFFF
jgi:HIV Tat-specific factor 1